MSLKSFSAAPVKYPSSTKPRWLRLEIAFVFAVCLLLSFRFLILVSNHAVNILYWDQWEYFGPMFDGKPWWELFRWQYGPWRVGAGFISYLIADLTHWNSRSEAFFIGGLVSLAMGAALWLKWRLFGKLNAYDIAIPLIVLTTAQFQAFAGAAHSTPTTFPMLLVVLYCLAWTARRKLPRYTLALIFNFLLVNTGYGLFIGPITITLFAIECWKQRASGFNCTGSIVALSASIGAFYWFVSDYNFEHLNSSIGHPSARAARFWEYPLFAGLMFGRFVRPEVGKITWLTYLAMLCGVVLSLSAVIILLIHCRRIFGSESAERRVSVVVVVLLGYTLLFAANTAFGRAGMGLNVSQSSRYVTVMIPGFLAIYFHLLTIKGETARRFGLPIFLLLLLPGHLPLRLGESHPASYYSRNKRVWKECYLRTGDYEKCESISDFKLLPSQSPEALKRKLDYLKQHRLNLFANPQ